MLQEKIVVGSGGEFPLNGLLTVPDSDNAPYPAIVFVHGSGSPNMDSEVYAVKPFKDFAEGLANLGVASIRYDKRSFAHIKKLKEMSKKDKEYMKNFTVKEEAIDDAILAAGILLSDSRIDSNRIFIAGISMGGLLAPRIDAEGVNFAGLIMMAAPARRMDELMKVQAEAAIKAMKSPIIKWLVKKQTGKLHKKLNNLYEMSDEEAKNIPVFNGTTAFYWKDMGKKRVGEYLKDVTKPILIMQGDGDFQVPVETEFNEYKRILENHANATFKLYPGLNHVFMPVVHGDINRAKEEYSKPQHVADYVIADIAQWINSI